MQRRRRNRNRRPIYQDFRAEMDAFKLYSDMGMPTSYMHDAFTRSSQVTKRQFALWIAGAKRRGEL